MIPDSVERLARAAMDRAGAWWAGVSLVAAAGFALAAAGVVGFVALADEVLEGETRRFDEAVLHWLADARTDWLDTVALQITALGNAATLAVVALAAAAILWAARRRVSVTLLALSLVSGTLVNQLLKVLFDRPRPEIDPLVEALTASFPSGHAMGAAITYGTVAYLVGRMAGIRVRRATWVGAAFLVLSIGVTRMYVGVHYPTDVLAGWLAGVAWTGLLVALFHFLDAFADELPAAGPLESELPLK
ncbi:MAG: phosphatase PAP2 family protein [Longimicrobiales bacterium]|nr:phosphatase PAP2 family protein [Longimicrobiales bacterium]